MSEIRRIILSSQPTTQRETTNISWFTHGSEQTPPPPEATSNTSYFTQPCSSQPKLVMVIDDSPTVRKIIEVSLRRAGLEVVSYPDGIKALQAVTNRQLNRLPDLVVLDLDLPKMNGHEIARYLRSKPQWSQTVIIILSRHDGILHRLNARAAGRRACMTKPFTA